MATSSYSNLFGTNGAEGLSSDGPLGSQANPWQQQTQQQGSQAGISTMFGQQRRPRRQQPFGGQQQPQPTFAQMQQQGMARPAPQPQMAQQPGQQAAPPQGAYQGFLGQLQQQLGQAISAPSGYDTEQFKQLRAQGKADIEAEFAGRGQALNEELARRGLSASSIGAGRMGDLEGQYGRAITGLEAQLLQQQAELGQRGRESVLSTLSQSMGQLGQQQLGAAEIDMRARELQQRAATEGRRLTLDEARLQVEQEQFRISEERRGKEFETTQALEQQRLRQQQEQFGEQLGFNREELALRGDLGRNEQALAERRLEQEGRLEEARQNILLKDLGQRQSQFEANLSAEDRRFVQGLEEQRAGRLQQLGISTRQLDQEAVRIQQQDRSLSLQEARDVAEIDFRAKQLQQQESQFGRQLSSEEARQRATLDLQRDQMAQQDQQFKASLGAEEQRFVRTLEEQQASRLQQLGLSTRELDQRATQILQQDRSLTLQEARDAAEVSYRADALAQQALLAGNQISADQARQEAQLAFQRDQLGVEEALRREGITVDRERLTAAQKQFDASLQVDKDRLAQSEKQFEEQMKQSDLDRALRQQLGFAEYTGMIGGQQTMAAQQAQQQLLIQLASVLAGSSAGIPANLMDSLNRILGVNQTTTNQTPQAQVGDLTPDGAYRWDGTRWVPVTPAGGTSTGSTTPPGGTLV